MRAALRHSQSAALPQAAQLSGPGRPAEGEPVLPGGAGKKAGLPGSLTIEPPRQLSPLYAPVLVIIELTSALSSPPRQTRARLGTGDVTDHRTRQRRHLSSFNTITPRNTLPRAFTVKQPAPLVLAPGRGTGPSEQTSDLQIGPRADGITPA